MTYTYRTRAGTFTLRRAANGWQAWFNDEYFDGPFASAQAAAEDVANGHSAWPSCGDPSRLGVPESLDDWYCTR